MRQRLPGDSYEPLGLHGTTKLTDAFINRKIPREERDALPIVLVGRRIAWCPRLPPAEAFRLSDDSLEALVLTYIDRKI